ncbi:biotin transporter BioY [soil metagenome]
MTEARHSDPLWRSVLMILGFVGLIAICARIAIPFYPVPITLQTWAVLVTGALSGPRRGVGAVALYLAMAAVGLPVLANGAGGLSAVTGGTAGYLIAFPAAAFIAGWAAEQGRLGVSLQGFVILLIAHAVTLALGVAWLILSIGLDPIRAVQVGATPFLIGAVIKSGLVLATLWIWRRWRARG